MRAPRPTARCLAATLAAAGCGQLPVQPTDASAPQDLPPAFLDVGSAEIFRDETVAYADALWNAGGDAELHVWPGGFHAFDIFAPHTALSRGMIATRSAWMSRVLGD